MRLQSKIYPLTIIIFILVSILISILIYSICSNNHINYLINSLYLQVNFLWLSFSNLNLYLTSLYPLIIGVLIVNVTMQLSPQQKQWSKIIIVSTSLFFMIRYFLWRSTSTFNLTDPINSLFSIGLFLIELAFIISPFWQTILTLNIKSRKSQADKMSEAVKEGIYQPTVDILIPSYNEPLEVVKRTIVGCQTIEYNHKKIYLLDDGDREEMKNLCAELNCHYITRENRLHAKAGNLNHALTQTNGELIVVFDADFVPTSNFLTRSIGFFQDIKIGLLQTYQSFYSHDPIARNLGLEDKIPTEVEIFSRYYQPIRDSINTALCYGSSFLVRRKYLEKIGGFVTKTLSEDYHTGIRLSSEKYQVIYLKESLSAGLSAENIFGHIKQRKRWARGTIQTLFIKENPLKLKGLKWQQKLAHLEGILQWFMSPLRLILLLLPFAYNCLDVIPIKTNFQETLSFFFPFYFIQLLTFSWFNFKTRSALFADIYNVVTAVPITEEIIQTLINPFSSIFNVTPKGIKNDNYYFNWRLASPLIFLLMVNFITFANFLIRFLDHQINYIDDSLNINLIIFWNVYNLVILVLSIMVMLDIPKLDSYQWLKIRKKINIITSHQTYETVTDKICEFGIEINSNFSSYIPDRGRIEFIEDELSLNFEVVNQNKLESKFKVRFINVSLLQYRQLIKIIFCQPNRWTFQQTQGELISLWLLFYTLFAIPFRFIKNMMPNKITNSY
ncbi:glycosyltransferase [Geminocystis sp. NIES-3709]|uniref:glycosyltransferase family 2 protein n=1 Tax=Geminocystis sp. NIES-3709 TaxID=1617448 RepID=UPI000824A845|nr:cellulose synthase catalytic subunit [Geminocystis sp. NIES-3709]